MMSTSKKIVFFGTDAFSLASLSALVEAGFSVAAVVTKPDSKQGRGHTLTPSVVKVYALEHSIPVWQPEKIVSIAADIESIGKPLGVLASFGKIIPQKIIDLFEPGIINVHPSLLPLLRGPTPIESAIAEGHIETGVSIMQLASGMDNGPVYSRQVHALNGTETAPELYATLAASGARLLLRTLPRASENILLPMTQDDSQATYSKLLSKNDAWLDPSKLSAAEAESKIRAHLIFPRTKLTIDSHTIIITKAHIIEKATSKIDIICRDGRALHIDEVVAPSGRTMSAADFERGYLRG